ncbi:ABC transporter ATP-binding protein [Mycoplasmopsis hyopharyngis]|uniref:ABC transporter ATP-binding protein n=1 Tax=Mycoplasmopsis hyopharyngis TaxID=29558 RepID=UPI003873AEFE
MNIVSNKNEVKISTFSLFKNLFRFLKKEKLLLFFGIFITICNALSYVSGSAIIGMIVKKFFSEPVLANGDLFDHRNFIIWLSLLILAFVMYSIFRLIQNRIFVHLTFKTSARMREKIMNKLLKMPISYYDKQKSGNLISILVNDVNNMSNSMLQMLNETFSNFFNALFSIIVMFFFSTLMSAIIFPFSILLFSLSALMIKKARPYYVKVQDKFGDLNAYVEEMLTNSKITKTFNKKEYAQEKFQEITTEIYKKAFIGDAVLRVFDPWYAVVSNVLLLVIVALAVTFKNANIPSYGINNAPFEEGLVLSYIALMYNYGGTIQSVLNVILTSQIGVASSARVYKLLNLETPKDIEDPEILDENIQGRIEFKNVDFRYSSKSSKYQLKGASFIAEPGQTIAIVGPTGAGKTTIINLLSKFYDYESGSITIDNHELRKIPSANLRDLVAIVLQDSFMFNDTIKNNLRLLNQNISDKQIEEVARMTFAHNFIENMPNGYDTIVENNGDNLSQGQRQLLAITRAILGNKKILILDEATSNIDSNTEQIIQKSLMEIMKNKTSFVIAHRLSTIKNADKILVVNDGQIIEQGTHDELLKAEGFYARLYQSQFDN